MSTITFTEEQIKEIILKETIELLRETSHGRAGSSARGIPPQPQGYLLKKVLGIDEITRWLKRNDITLDIIFTVLAIFLSRNKKLDKAGID